MEYASIICECLIGTVFLIAVGTKLRNAESFGAFVASVRQLAPARMARWSRPIAGAVAGLEGLVPVLLLAEPTAGASLVLAAALLIAFTTAIVAALRRGAGVACRCFGAAELPLGRRHVVRNTVLLVAAAVGGAAAPTGLLSAGAAELAMAAAVSLPGVVALVALDYLVELFTPSVLVRSKES